MVLLHLKEDLLLHPSTTFRQSDVGTRDKGYSKVPCYPRADKMLFTHEILIYYAKHLVVRRRSVRSCRPRHPIEF